MSPGLRYLREIPTGARVRKPSAIALDYAFGRTGTVMREEFADGIHAGVLFDGGTAIIEYPEDIEFELLGAEES